jgi:hypothetical protein
MGTLGVWQSDSTLVPETTTDLTNVVLGREEHESRRVSFFVIVWGFLV